MKNVPRTQKNSKPSNNFLKISLLYSKIFYFFSIAMLLGSVKLIASENKQLEAN